MRIHTKLIGKEALHVTFVSEEEQKKPSKSLQKKLAQHTYFTGKLEQEILVQGTTDNLILGIEEYSTDNMRKMCGYAARFAKKHHYERYSLDLNDKEELISSAVEGSLLGLYKYREYKKSSKDEPKDPTHLTILSTANNLSKHIKKGKILAENNMFVRDLVNRPASDKTPKMVASIAKKLAKDNGLEIRIIGQRELERYGLNAMLAVSRGSDKEPQLVIMELNPQRKSVETAIVGKGVTFDAGGLQIKPGQYMVEMKSDMAGAATVLGTMISLAQLGCKKRVIGVLGLVENLVGPDAYKPGDILKAYNGKTIEIGHTDAEGRLVLADALSFIEDKYQPKEIIDVATLTGAVTHALGYRVAAVLGNNEELMSKIKDASKASDELVWELPLYNHYKKIMDCDVADVNNIGKKPGPYGGAGTITAAAFLSQFINKAAWVHIDIAGTAFAYEKSSYIIEGGTGWGVNLLSTTIMGD